MSPWLAAAIALLLNGAKADDLGGQNGGPAPTTSEQSWHGRGHSGGHGRGGDDGDNGGNGGVIIGMPSSPGPDYPYPPGPYPKSGAPLPAPSAEPAAQSSGSTQSWPVWYYCDQPNGYYPYVKVCGRDWQRLPVMPPPPGSAPPLAENSWEHCDDPEGYFPYIAQCRHRWVPMAASSPVPGDDPDGIPIIAQWFYCEDAKDYLPYVGSCPHVWHTVPSVPPPNIQSANKSKTAPDQR